MCELCGEIFCACELLSGMNGRNLNRPHGDAQMKITAHKTESCAGVQTTAAVVYSEYTPYWAEGLKLKESTVDRSSSEADDFVLKVHKFIHSELTGIDGHGRGRRRDKQGSE